MSAVLAILMDNPDKWPGVADQLAPEMFPPGESEVFAAYAEMARQGKKPDAVLMSESFPPDHHAQEIIQRCVEGFESAHSLEGHVAKLREAYKRRQAQTIGRNLADGMDPDDAVRKLTELSADTARSTRVVDLRGPFITELSEQADRGFSGLTTGLADLDNKLGGLRPGNVCIVAGRPGMGKTALALNIAQAQEAPVAFFSLEMSERELLGRMVAYYGVDYGRITTPRKGQDFAPITAALNRIPQGFHICDKGGQTITEIEAESYRLKHSVGIELVVVDYLQLVRSRGADERAVVEDVSRRLKALAKNLELSVIAVAQLNRSVETRGGEPRPRISDLRESGQIEQDADQIIFPYRPSYYERDGDDVLIVAKHRAGHTGDIPIIWQGRHQRFVNSVRGIAA